ncbi:beta-ketoacyl-ACP reductase [Malaciobacter pacificus]|uniref:Short-chain dehydrogenase/reductase n=1 Tax=Malaciobacter pacificus TaxID=1080223 RepID=A0A5C2H8J2_9BACT|nr:SDR family oxidoreductase [Malaciobacter pacificus]QEP33785.1 short-chain dehydrogenase/reductase [Malaciobacter pacificus]GGD33335.1 beta-ketoacyl-ACP reductase [Malaciobacter pacificus]
MSKKVLITGGNKGIGLCVSRAMLEFGYEIVIVARDFEDCPIVGVENVTAIEYDLSDVDNLPKLMEEVGEVDILINNAGYMQPKYTYDNYPKEAKEHLMNVDLHTPVELMNLVSVSMKKKKFGRIVNTASIAGQIGHPDVWYGIAKAGLINATKIYAKLLGTDGITVNCVAPSAAETGMQKDNDEARKKAFKAAVVTNRFAEPEEVAKAIVWLATDCPEYINGITIDINNCFYPR